jgi:hypothetical protein
VHLDLAGRIPTADETRAFLADRSPDKRQRLIDQLLGGPDYSRRMTELFHVMLMERRGDNPEWEKFLRTAFEQNRPWDEIARGIIQPDDADESRRGAAFFLTSRLVSEGAMAAVDVPGLTRDVGRLLAGVDLQCAQCHDHISIDDYTQQDFQGLHMIFENVAVRRGAFPAVDEKLMTAPKEFMSVFIQQPETTTPRVPGGPAIEIPTFPKGEEYLVPPDRKTRSPGVPKFSPLKELAAGLASAENELFCRNIANRLWWVMMGRGLVEPLDLQHSANPPNHPELLDLLATEFAAHHFDVKWLLHELALSETYQRTSAVAPQRAPTPPTSFLSGNEKRISAEQLFWSALIAIGEFDAQRAALKGDAKKSGRSIEQIVKDSKDLTKLQDLFVDAFANPPTEPEIDFEPTVKAALFLMHEERVLNLLKPKPGNLTDRLAKLDDNAAAEELFVSILSHQPTAEDRADVLAYLTANKDRRETALRQLAWALLSGTEFCVNH